MKPETPFSRIRVFIILRLFIATLLLFLGQYVFHVEILIFYYLIAAVCVLSVVYLGWLVSGRGLSALMWVQIVFDTALETILIYFTGGVDSLFAPIYVMSIISAGIFLAPAFSFVVAGLCSFLFSSLVILTHQGFLPLFVSPNDTWRITSQDTIYLFYATYVRITIFFVVAILTNYSASRILSLEEKVRIQRRLAILGDITSQIAHEIRNPLAAISNSVEVLSENLKSTLAGADKQLMTAVIEESERLKRVFSKILDYSRIGDLNMQDTSLTKLMDHVLLLFSHLKEFNGEVMVKKKYLPAEVFALVDPEQMVDVFSNVVRNAYEAMPHGGTLEISIKESKSGVGIGFKDSGEGFRSDILKSLFLPFKTSKKTGTGLGLAQAHKIISLHGGSMQIKSYPGRGSEVRIQLRQPK